VSRTGVPKDTVTAEPDPRIPFPVSAQRLACREHPEWFSHDNPTAPEAREDTERAQLACSGCPIAASCLKWALANPTLTTVGVWAATTPRERTTLRRRLIDRHGPDWVGVVAEKDRQRVERRRTPPSVSQQREQHEQRLARLELELIPRRPPAPPRPASITPHQTAANRAPLLAAPTERQAA
jgi:transcription factor WhiB